VRPSPLKVTALRHYVHIIFIIINKQILSRYLD